jgi:hypothetical protein
MFSALNAAEVRYLVVGAYAVMHHARPRFTKDLDLWIAPDAENAARAWKALAAFGAPLGQLRPDDLRRADSIYQIGVAPNRIDILAALEGVDFEAAWASREESRYGEQRIWILSRADLIANKRAVGRPSDLEDVRELERRAPPRP